MSPVFGHGRLRLYLLKLLDEGPRHGYDVIRELEDRFMGLYSPSAGTVYPRLARLEAEGLVRHEEADGRKVYSITDAGRADLAARRAELDDLEEELAGSVRELADDIREQVHGSVRDLKAELKAAAREVRREARQQARRPPRPDGRAQQAPAWLVAAVAELNALTRGRLALTEQQRTELREVLTRTTEDVRRILAQPR